MTFIKVLIVYLAIGSFMSLVTQSDYRDYMRLNGKEDLIGIYGVLFILLWPLVIYGVIKGILVGKE